MNIEDALDLTNQLLNQKGKDMLDTLETGV